LNYLLLFGIARSVLPESPRRTPLLLALAGMLGTAFLAQLGNSMGDNLSALFVLGALWLLLRRWPKLIGAAAGGLAAAAGAGLVMGLGCGLKLTNATYAVALCVALLTVPGAPRRRLGLAFVFGLGVLGGMSVTAGHWFWLMYQSFGNPLFPQFNNHFLAPLAAPIGIGDTNWLPKSWLERLLWPFVFALEPKRVGEIPLRLWLWPLLYVAMLALGALRLIRRGAGAVAAGPQLQRQRLLLAFFALAYLAWLNLFAIYRYLVPLELLAPLAAWMVLTSLLPREWAAPAAAAMIAATVAVDLPRASWGHARWAASAFSAQVPSFPAPSQNMIFTVHGDPPMGWLATRFPDGLAFVALGSGFPESPGFVERVRQMTVARKGPLYVMLQADRADPAQPRDGAALERARQADGEVLAKGGAVLARYGYTLDGAGCKAYPAFIGQNRWTYQLCPVTPR
jgi:hypothetical protein